MMKCGVRLSIKNSELINPVIVFTLIFGGLCAGHVFAERKTPVNPIYRQP